MLKKITSIFKQKCLFFKFFLGYALKNKIKSKTKPFKENSCVCPCICHKYFFSFSKTMKREMFELATIKIAIVKDIFTLLVIYIHLKNNTGLN